MQRLRFRLWPLVAMVLLGACSSDGPLHKPAELQPLQAQLSVKKQWQITTPASKLNSIYDRLTPLVSGDRLYTLGAQGVVTAIDIHTREKAWTTDLAIPVSAALGYNDSALFIGSADGEVIAMSRQGGEVLWRKTLSTEILAAPSANADYVIAICGDGMVYALGAADGQVLWQLRRNIPALTLRGASQAVLAADKVLVGTAEGHLLAISLYSGDLLWDAVVAAPKGRTDLERMVDVDATPIVVNGVIYTTAYQGRIMALSLDTGSILWRRDIGSWAGMTVDDNNVYLVEDNSHVWALDRRSGATLWRQDGLEYRSLSTPTLFDNALVVGDFQGYLHWLSLEDGHIMARYQGESEKPIRAPLQVADGRAYVRNVNGLIEVLATGKPSRAVIWIDDEMRVAR